MKFANKAEIDTDPDTELMLRLKEGEDLMLNQLMTRWQQPLAAFIYRHIGHQADALDLAQETFVRVYETRHRYTPSAKFSTWLFTIAVNLCRNHMRWQRRHGQSATRSLDGEDAELAGSIISSDDSPVDATIKSETICAVKDAIAKLPQDLRTAILLYEYEGLSYEEISGILRCSVKAIEMKLYRARKLLRETLSRSSL
jgi:RNA polymerase sigma factor (sigma-70 family)